MKSLEKSLYRFKLLVACAPFPFECTVTAKNLESAKKKVKFQGSLLGLKTGKVLEFDKTAYQS